MKKLFLLVLALLLVTGVAFATNIPTMVDPKNLPTVWTELVYNGSGSDIATGVVVIWDFDTSDSDAGTIYDDTAPWVKLCDDESSPWTAGVTTIGQGIANGAVGRIVILGPAVVHRPTNGTAVTVNTFVSADADGRIADETASNGEAVLGCVIKANASGNDIEGDIGVGSSLIYINPTYVID